jgi:hypothetical protein
MEIDSKYIAYNIKHPKLCSTHLENIGLNYGDLIPNNFVFDSKIYKTPFSVEALNEVFYSSRVNFVSYFTNNYEEEFRLYK